MDGDFSIEMGLLRPQPLQLLLACAGSGRSHLGKSEAPFFNAPSVRRGRALPAGVSRRAACQGSGASPVVVGVPNEVEGCPEHLFLTRAVLSVKTGPDHWEELLRKRQGAPAVHLWMAQRFKRLHLCPGGSHSRALYGGGSGFITSLWGCALYLHGLICTLLPPSVVRGGPALIKGI